MRKTDKLYKEGKYQEAIPYAIEASVIAEKAFGPEDPKLAINLSILAEMYRSTGEYDKAEPIFQRALAIQEKAFGPEHPSVATSLVKIADLYAYSGNYGKAEPLFQRALNILEKVLGPDHPSVAITLNNLAELYRSLGNYGKAEPMYKRALTIQEKVLGPDHHEVGMILNNLAGLYESLGDYSKAEPLFQRALAIQEKTLGPDHPTVATTLNNLAGLYRSLGDYSKAEPLFQRALAIQEKTLGPDHPTVATTLNNLAGLYESLGDYLKAEPLYQRALAIKEKAFGPEHPSVATTLNNLAGLYQSLGDYGKAESLYKRALAIMEKILGPEHPDVGIGLGNLGGLYQSSGNYGKAEPFFQRALAIQEKTLGPDHPTVATTLNNLAGLYESLGDYSKAEPMYKRSLTIREKAFGPEHPDVGIGLGNLAGLYQSLGDYGKAEPMYKRSLTIREKAFGPEHPDVGIGLGNLAGLYAAMNQNQNAYELLKRVQLIDEKLIDQVVSFTSKSQKMRFISARNWDLHYFFNLFNQHFFQSPFAQIDVLNAWFKRKGVILESQKRFQETLFYSGDPETVQTFQKLNRTRVQLSNLIFSGLNKIGVEEYKNKINQLQKQKEDLEAKMSQLSHAFFTQQKVVKADTQKVARSLPANTVLVEFIRMYGCDLKATDKQNKRPPDRYLAFILHSGKGERVEFVDLGSAVLIDQGIASFKRLIISNKDQKISEMTETCKALYSLVFKPLQKGIGNSTELFISPDGNLNLIPFEILQSPEGRFLIEDYTLNYLSAGRDILGFGQIKEKGTKALIMGDPDFNMEEGQKSDTLRRLALAQPEGNFSTKRSVDMHNYFKKLPGTKVEVQKIMTLFGEDKADGYIGREALEEVLFNRGAPKILHLATHGFFLSDEKLMMNEDPLQRDFQFYSKPQIQPAVKVENPLVRSGIALAGANRTLNSGDPAHSDGIVTAEKILGLRLRGTDMVVLSACDTGLGVVQNGEGVYGLRRAFTQAGTKSLVMSMWSVPDRETQELMVAFYENILSGKMNRCQALRQAALKQMKITKKRYGQPHPLYWGAFVFLGEH